MAIARLGSSSIGTAGSTVNKTLTFSHTVSSGSNLRLIVGVGFEWNGSQTITNVTWNGTAMSIGKAEPTNANGDMAWVYFLDNPDVGTYNVVVNGVTNPAMHGDLIAIAQTYSGVKQTGSADASNGASSATGTTASVSTTTVADNCWAVMAGYASGGTLSAGTNSTSVGISGNGGMVDNQTYGDITPAGSFTLNITQGSSSPWCMAMMSMEPDVAASTFTPKVMVF